jgi:hypothetical protein
MMAQTRWIGPENLPYKDIEEDTAQSVITAYTAAVTGSEGMRRRAFDAALRAYRMRHPAVSETIARRRVAKILCFAGEG